MVVLYISMASLILVWWFFAVFVHAVSETNRLRMRYNMWVLRKDRAVMRALRIFKSHRLAHNEMNRLQNWFNVMYNESGKKNSRHSYKHRIDFCLRNCQMGETIESAQK